MVDTVQRRLWKLLEGYLLRAGLSVVPQVYFKAYQVPGTCSAGGREPCEQDTHDHSFMSSWESPACLESYLLSPTRADPHMACMDLALVQMVLEDLDPPRRAGEGHEVGLCGDPEGKGSGGCLLGAMRHLEQIPVLSEYLSPCSGRDTWRTLADYHTRLLPYDSKVCPTAKFREPLVTHLLGPKHLPYLSVRDFCGPALPSK